MKRVALTVCLLIALACGGLQNKAMLVNPGDDKDRVEAVMGSPQDRQFQGDDEVWQYCQTGAGFGYHDFRMIWFYRGRVTGITSYKNHTPASGCAGHFIVVRWEDAPSRH